MTILNSTDILAPNGSMMLGAVICLLAGVIGFIVFLCEDGIDKLGPLVFFIITIILGITCIFGANKVGDPTGRYTLEVTLDDTVSFKEICEEYKFIEQRGDIYVFETKEVEEK